MAVHGVHLVFPRHSGNRADLPRVLWIAEGVLPLWIGYRRLGSRGLLHHRDGHESFMLHLRDVEGRLSGRRQRADRDGAEHRLQPSPELHPRHRPSDTQGRGPQSEESRDRRAQGHFGRLHDWNRRDPWFGQSDHIRTIRHRTALDTRPRCDYLLRAVLIDRGRLHLRLTSYGTL
ncbi:hypothetical protein BAD_1257 [Bifidobacterium adolescentis ATCC 15703]|uniref:Uncharacterized protein n=1 Tax=Bifidobacterium adolescentis (strain ATCC 15703 / DSM 20083 / NCTC 11814 / E194a) TaxID=367928 RepID=A1A2V5_BIFAA|nr:hypothetical protein BAD_1257 [Bifidobacterium adolescentis ATCC 15703]